MIRHFLHESYPSSSLLTQQNLASSSSSVQTLPFSNEMSSSYTVPVTRKLTDHYMTVSDLSPTEETVPVTNYNPSITDTNSSADPFSSWYENLTFVSAPVSVQSDQPTYSFTFSPTQTSSSNDYLASTTAPLIDDFIPSSTSFSTDIPISSQSRPSISSESTSKHSSSPTKSDSSTLDDEISVESTKKKDKKKLSFLHASKKGKDDKRKQQISEEVSCIFA